MQTFLPYRNFNLSARCLDYKRLGKQRVEAWQILNALRGQPSHWATHPAVRMWKGREKALEAYLTAIITEWLRRGYVNNIIYQPIWQYQILPPEIPRWLGRKEFHDSHKSNLLRKDPVYYRQFGWRVPDNLPYYWPKEDEVFANKLNKKMRELTNYLFDLSKED